MATTPAQGMGLGFAVQFRQISLGQDGQLVRRLPLQGQTSTDVLPETDPLPGYDVFQETAFLVIDNRGTYPQGIGDRPAGGRFHSGTRAIIPLQVHIAFPLRGRPLAADVEGTGRRILAEVHRLRAFQDFHRLDVHKCRLEHRLAAVMQVVDEDRHRRLQGHRVTRGAKTADRDSHPDDAGIVHLHSGCKVAHPVQIFEALSPDLIPG